MSSSTTQSAVRPAARSRPPFRADHVGSLLRPPELQQARAAWKAGTLAPDALRAVEDRCIAAAIRKQEELGLRAATDGEYRRAYWHYDFVSGLDGVELYEPEQKIQFKGNVALPHMLRVNGRIGWSKPVMLDHYQFVADHVTTAMPKMTIPSPSVVHFRGGRRAIDPKTYPGPGRVLRRSGRGLPEGGGGVRRGGLPVSAAGRGEHRLSVRPGADRQPEGARRTCGEPAGRSMPTC